MRAGDLIIMGTDGLFDNLTIDEIGYLVHERQHTTAAAKVSHWLTDCTI